MPILLVVDDEPAVCYSFRRVFGADGFEVVTASTAAAGLQLAQSRAPDVVVLDLQLPDRSGLELFQDLHAADPRRPVLFITAHGTADTAIEAMKRGAFDYLVKPVDFDRVSQVIGRAFETARLSRTPVVLPADDEPDHIVGRSLVMQEMCKALGRAAPLDGTVLIRGESGVGKELVARALYQHSRRADKPFLAINCAALPETLLESELFGHEKGAFTGADRRRIGKFEQCDEGTLFLDEVGDMPAAVQAKMLRVLQEQRFERLGGGQTVETRVRVLAATNQDVEALVEAGRFRKDLYYRLNVIGITVPPLRERRDDVPELAHHFLFQFSARHGRDVRGFAPEALDLLRGYDWPGNVRQLRNTIEVALVHATGHLLLPEFLPPFVREPAAPPRREPAATNLAALIDRLLAESPGDAYRQVVEVVERTLFAEALRRTHGHQTQASELLGISRATLRTRLRDLGLAIDKVVVPEPGDPPDDPVKD